MLGFLNVYKPSGMTSHDVVQKIRKLLAIKQIGHAGTLDPLAEGVLPIAIGPACRLLRFLTSDKIYLADILFGRQTDTDDIEGATISMTESDNPPSAAIIIDALRSFSGKIMQRPPLYSAIHQSGKRLYQLARAGETPEIAERQVFIESIRVLKYTYPVLTVRVSCGGGTYIRSIARDLGESIGLGGCLKALAREKSGAFDIGSAIKLVDYSDKHDLQSKIEKPIRALSENKDLRILELPLDQIKALVMGQDLNIDSLNKSDFSRQSSDVNRIVATFNSEVVAICKITENKIKPEVVIANAE